jgi:S-adenosylmethionine synthetase
MAYLFTSESVSEGHPDKVADQISDAILDAKLAQDPLSRVACETLVTTGLVVVAGEITSRASVNVQEIVRETIREIGYTRSEYKFDADSCGIIVALDQQSPDINRGVDRGDEDNQGAGDQGMMFGYASNETEELMPMPLAFSHRLLQEMARIRKEGKEMPYLRPDSKSQVTIAYDDNHKPLRVHTIVISTQHDPFDADDAVMQAKIEADVRNIVIPRVIPAELLDDKTILHVNPTGKFVIGGPHGDAGLTGRKIIVDTYGGKGAHGGGAFSGKDPSKVDRSAAYASRHMAKNAVAAGLADEILVQVSYAIGVVHPISLYVNTYGTSKVNFTDVEISDKLSKLFDMRPGAIQRRLGLAAPIYKPTAAYGHMGRQSYEAQVDTPGGPKTFTFFPWERLDMVEAIRQEFGI